MTMKFRAHETFFIRKGWLTKGMKNITKTPDVFVSKEDNPMDVLGIGTNMVKSLRYWLQAVGLTTEPKSGKRIQQVTPLGEMIMKYDPYMEELGTILLLQYCLASNRDLATSWYYFFNEFKLSEFTREDFVTGLQAYALANGESVATRSLNDDFNCIVNTYLPRFKTSTKRVSPESNIDCPLGELGLIDIVNKQKKIYRKSMPNIAIMDPWIILAVIMDQSKGNTEIALNDLLKSPNNIGCVFNMDVIGMIEALHKTEKLGVIKIIRTAGMDIIRINTSFTFSECVKKYYESIGDK